MFYLWSVCLLPGLWELVVAWLVGLAWLVGSCLYVVILYRADAPFPKFLGEVLSVLFSGCLLARCIVLCLLGHCSFGNKFLIIQKKKSLFFNGNIKYLKIKKKKRKKKVLKFVYRN